MIACDWWWNSEGEERERELERFRHFRNSKPSFFPFTRPTKLLCGLTCSGKALPTIAGVMSSHYIESLHSGASFPIVSL